jgi:hypothetical protein
VRKGGGHAKGSSFERKMARELSSWWYGRDDCLWRRPGNEVRSNRPSLHTGDIVPDRDVVLSKEWPYHVELKCWAKKRLKLDMLLWPDRSPIRKIWKKAIEERRKDLIPMLILKANNVPPICVMRRKDASGRVRQSSYAVIDIDENNTVVVFPWVGVV